MKNKPLKTNRAVLKNEIKKHGIKTIYYVDRLSVYLDAYSKEQNLQPLLDDNEKNMFIRQPLPHNEFFDRKVELYQPSKQCLSHLTDAAIVSGDCAITYIEFAVDFITDDQQLLEILVLFFNRHLVRIPSKRSKAAPYHYDYDGTVYLSPKQNDERLLFYSDKPARKESKPRLCLHVEFRLSGWGVVKKRGIVTIEDLMAFDHQQLWDTLLDFRSPNYTKLGRSCKFNKSSPQAAHKRGTKEWQSLMSLQQYFHLHPQRESAFFSKITPDKFSKCWHDCKTVWENDQEIEDDFIENPY